MRSEREDAEIERLRDKVRELNRRCQLAESAAEVTVEECERKGVSLARSLAGWAYANQKRENKELRAQLAESRQDAFAEARKAVEAEEELDGRMPDAVWDRLRDSRQATEDGLRAAVRATKRNILARLATPPDTGTPPGETPQ